MVPEQASTYDVVFIGDGPGECRSVHHEGTDLTAILVEGELLGGECSYYACMPSKALLGPIEVAAASANLSGLRPSELSAPDLLARHDEWVSRRAVILATGAEPVVSAPLQGLEAWGSRCATGVQEIPQRLIVVGGVVACEAATWMSSLGNDVTMLVCGPRLLSAAESFTSRFIEKALAARGITVITDAQVVAAERPQASDTGLGRVHGGPVTVTCAGRTIEADEILVPTGRRPPPDRHGAEGRRPEPDDVLAGCLPDWLYAVSDASGEAQLTHMGKYRARAS